MIPAAKPLIGDEEREAVDIMVYQVPMPEPLRKLEPSERETRNMHAWAEYGLMQVRLYESIARFGDHGGASRLARRPGHTACRNSMGCRRAPLRTRRA